MLKIINIVGARPNFMKMAPIVAAMNRHPDEISHILVHTGQHYDEAMSESFFRDLGMPAPDVNLEVGSGTHAEQTARVMLAFEPVLVKYKPDWVVVVGDVNSTLACALVAAKLGVKVAHVEAGLRSNDWSMPEEVNRVLTDRLADLLLTPSLDADENLLQERVAPDKILCVGNVMIDTLLLQVERAKQMGVLEQLGLSANQFAVMTLHRPSNVDDKVVLQRLFWAIGQVAEKIPVVFPAHPRTQARIQEFGIALPIGVKIINPMGYLDFLGLWSNARLVLTDSGGLQEETTALGIPCLTLRENTERPVTVEYGTNQVVGTGPQQIIKAAQAVLLNINHKKSRIPAFWDGKAADRVVNALLSKASLTKEIQRTTNG